MPLEKPPPTLYDPASPSSYDPLQSPIDPAFRPPSSQTVNPKFLNMDEPRPSIQLPQLSLPYEDSQPSNNPLKEALSSGKAAAHQRTSEVETLSGPIADILERYCTSNRLLSKKHA